MKRERLLFDLQVFTFLALVFTLSFYTIYGLGSYITTHHHYRFYIHFEFEKNFSFIPAFSAVYLSVGIMLCLSLFVLREWRNMIPFFFALVWETCIAGIFFILFPVEPVYPLREATGFWGIIFQIADTANLEYNLFSSLHVTFAFTCLFVYWKYSNIFHRIIFLFGLGVLQFLQS